MKCENVLIQMVDCPPMSADNCPPALTASIRTGDGIMIVVDASSDSCLDDVDEQFSLLRERKVIEDGKPLLVVASMVDLPRAVENAAILAEACPEVQLVRVSTTSGHGIRELPETVFKMLKIIRIYLKPPGMEPDRGSPVTLRAGSTVADLAETIHRDLPQTMKGAKVWGSTRFGGQLAARDWVLEDEDVVEFRT
jgi:ribosome-interacting GTPase 1